LQVSVSPINLQNSKLTFRVTLGKTTIINSVALSWIAFSPSTASFASYGGQINQNQYSGSVSSDISSSIYQSQYSIYGITLLSILGGKAITFGSSIDSNFIITISSSIPIDSFSLVYVALGQLPSKQCLNCGAASILNNGFCFSECPANTYAFTYKDGGVACRSCSSKLGLILVNDKCVPGSSTTTTTITTQTIATAQTVPGTDNTANSNSTSSGSSGSGQGSSSVNNTVVNPTKIVPAVDISGSSTNTPVTPVVPVVPSVTCPKNSYFNGNECVCEVGFVFVNGACSASKSSISVPIIITYPLSKVPCNTTTS